MKYTVLGISLAACIGLGFFAGNKINLNIFSNKADININTTVKEVLPNAEYSSLVYHYSAVITHSDMLNIFQHDIPLTEKKLLYTIDGTIKLGFDGKDIRVDNQYNQVILRMPKIKILSHEVYPETFSLYDEKSGLFNRYSVKDYNDIQLIHKQEQEQKVHDNAGLYTQSRQSAEQQFEAFLTSLPEIKNNKTIVFEWEL